MLLFILLGESATAQVGEEGMCFLNYNIRNKVLKKEIDRFLTENKKGYEGVDKVVWMTINFDLKFLNTVYRIGYKTDFDFFSIKERKKNRFDHPDIVTKFNKEYLFIYMGYPNDIFIDNKKMFDIAKLCFPKQYELFLENTIRINGSHQQPALELKFKNNELISKRKYEGHF